jgi:hypothetical protein
MGSRQAGSEQGVRSGAMPRVSEVLMHTTGPGAPSHRHTRAQIEAAIVRAETDLTRGLERLERRRAAGRDCTVTEGMVRSIQTRLASLHEYRKWVLQAEDAGEA